MHALTWLFPACYILCSLHWYIGFVIKIKSHVLLRRFYSPVHMTNCFSYHRFLLSCIIGLIVGGALNTHVELELELNQHNNFLLKVSYWQSSIKGSFGHAQQGKYTVSHKNWPSLMNLTIFCAFISCRYTRNRRWIESLAVNSVNAASRCYCRHAISLCISQPVCLSLLLLQLLLILVIIT